MFALQKQKRRKAQIMGNTLSNFKSFWLKDNLLCYNFRKLETFAFILRYKILILNVSFSFLKVFAHSCFVLCAVIGDSLYFNIIEHIVPRATLWGHSVWPLTREAEPGGL